MNAFLRLLAAIAALLAFATPVAGAQAADRDEALFVNQPDSFVLAQGRAFGDGVSLSDSKMATEYRDVRLDDRIVSVRTRRLPGQQTSRVIDPAPIADAYGGRFELAGAIVIYERPQDQVSITLDTRDGIVRANGLFVTVIPNVTTIDDELWLQPQAIAVLTGTVLAEDADGVVSFERDHDIRPTTDLDLWIDGQPVTGAPQQTRMVGTVLLIPLRPVVERLGHSLREESGTVCVTRVQDSAEISLDLVSGLFAVNGTPRGSIPNMAFADRGELLLPSAAIEALTGVSIRFEPASNRVDILQDDRLGSLAMPGEMAAAQTGRDGWVPETLSYQLSDRGPLVAQLSGRTDRLNGRLTYESAGGFENRDEFQPRGASLDLQSLDGWAGTVGDYTDRFNELSGVDVSRIRGASYRERTKNGSMLAIAAGSTLSGTEAISDTAIKPEFGGVAAGVRLLSEDGSQEVGASGKSVDGGNTSAFVVSGQKVFEGAGDTSALKTAFISADAGYFDTTSGSDLDVRVRGQARYRLSDQLDAAVSAYHDGEKFVETAEPAIFEGIFDTRVGARTGGAVSADWRSAKSWGMLPFVAAGVRASYDHLDGASRVSEQELTASVITRVGEGGPDVSIQIVRTETEINNLTSVTEEARIQAFQSFQWGTVQARYVTANSDLEIEDRDEAVVQVQSNPLRKSLGNDAFVSLAPTATIGWNGDVTAARVGGAAAASSGRLFGERFRLDGQVAALSSIDPDDFETRYFVGAEARYLLGKKTQFVARYVDDLNGRKDFSIALRGTVEFNEPRKRAMPLVDTGMLSGTVFVDLNRDGLRQDDEPGLPGASLALRGADTNISADSNGRFTGENLKAGLSAIAVSEESLPLGYGVAAGGNFRSVSIARGRSTSVDVPVILEGQMRGSVFIDMDGDGTASEGDQRLEGQVLQLIEKVTGDITETTTAAFGQYGFERLRPGSYQLRVVVGWQEYSVDVELTEDHLLHVVPVAIPVENEPLLDRLQAETDFDPALGA